MTKISFLLTALFFTLTTYAQRFSVMSYNCENAFDTIHDAGKDDVDFLPDGNRHWTRKRMYDKLKRIGKVILSVDSLRPVDIVCLNEVENDTVLTYLTKRTALNRVGYEYVMTNSLDDRGIDVALLYSPFTFHLISYNSIRPTVKSRTRDVLHVCGWVASGDTVDVFAVHLPSKLNGRTSERNRLIIARQITDRIDSLEKVRTNPHVIVMGDFNDGPSTDVVRNGFKGLHNLMTTKDHSYKYQGQWDCIDQLLVNDNMRRKLIKSGVASKPFMLEPDERYSGQKPKRTYIGWKYHDGYSDHLPVTASFEL